MTKSLAGAARVVVLAALTGAILPWSASAQQAADEVVLRAVPAAVVPPQVYRRAVERDRQSLLSAFHAFLESEDDGTRRELEESTEAIEDIWQRAEQLGDWGEAFDPEVAELVRPALRLLRAGRSGWLRTPHRAGWPRFRRARRLASCPSDEQERRPWRLPRDVCEPK